MQDLSPQWEAIVCRVVYAVLAIAFIPSTFYKPAELVLPVSVDVFAIFLLNLDDYRFRGSAKKPLPLFVGKYPSEDYINWQQECFPKALNRNTFDFCSIACQVGCLYLQ